MRTLTLLALLLCAPPLLADDTWHLMSRQGECVALAHLKRKLPEIGDAATPASLTARLRQSGQAVYTADLPGAPGQAVEVRLPGRGLSFLLATDARCQSLRDEAR